jgi:hypothetical protein
MKVQKSVLEIRLLVPDQLPEFFLLHSGLARPDCQPAPRPVLHSLALIASWSVSYPGPVRLLLFPQSANSNRNGDSP